MDDLSSHINTEQAKARLERMHDAAVRAPLEQRIKELEDEWASTASALAHIGVEPWRDGRSLLDGKRTHAQHIGMVVAALTAERDEARDKLRRLKDTVAYQERQYLSIHEHWGECKWKNLSDRLAAALRDAFIVLEALRLSEGDGRALCQSVKDGINSSTDMARAALAALEPKEVKS